MQRLKAEIGPKRVQSQGISVLSDKFVSSKATRQLIESDVREREHVPVQRKRQTTDAFEEGFLVIGANAITFLGKDKSIVASHPLAFLETYCIDLHEERMLTYTIKQTHFLKKEDIMSFSFVAFSVAVAHKLVRTLDRFLLANIRNDKLSQAQVYHLDTKKEHTQNAVGHVDVLEGERIVCDRSIINAEAANVLGREQKTECLAVFNPRGIILLSDAGDNKGLLEAFSYRAIKSFGTSDEGCFGFRVSDRNLNPATSAPPRSPRGTKPAPVVGAGGDDWFVQLYSEESAHLMNTLVMRHAKLWEALKAEGKEPVPFPITYTTSDNAGGGAQ